MVLSVLYLPLFVVQIVFNTAVFWTAILGYFINDTEVTRFNILCMIGCFLGVVTLVMSKAEGPLKPQEIIDNSLRNNIV